MHFTGGLNALKTKMDSSAEGPYFGWIQHLSREVFQARNNNPSAVERLESVYDQIFRQPSIFKTLINNIITKMKTSSCMQSSSGQQKIFRGENRKIEGLV